MIKNLYLLLLVLTTAASCTDEAPTPPDSLPLVSIDEFNVREGNEDLTVFLSVRLSKASDEQVTIFVESEDVTAEAGQDYQAISTAITFAAGDVQENIQLNIIGDEESEIDETFNLNITDASGATIGTPSVSITIENDDAGNGMVVIPSAGYITPTEYDGMNLLWSDEFDAQALNEEFWTFEIGNGSGGWGNNELEFYRKENTSMVDGHLVIEAREEQFGGFSYTSSRIITQNKFEFTHGRVDIRAVLPEGQGVWPALWMLGENISTVGWPRCGEMDIMEIVGHEPSKLHATVHYANTGGNHIFKGSSTDLNAGAKFSDEFHVFSMEWEENRIQFLLDDQVYYTVTPTILGTNNPYPFNDPFFFIFNVAVGGNWPGSPNGTTLFPQHMIVDYIRVFQPE